MNLTRFDNDGIELIIDTQTGEAFSTQAGYTRMSELSQQAVNKRSELGDRHSSNTLATGKGGDSTSYW